MITVEPLAGLANRMRVINSALSLAKDLDIPLKVIWTPYKGLQCQYYEIFDQSSDFEVVEQRPFILYETRFFYVYFFLRSLYYHKKYNLVKRVRLDAGDIKMLKNLDKKHSIYLASVHAFYINEDRKFYKFKPTRDIMDRVSDITGKFNMNSIGIHIRRSDNIMSSKFSNTEKFIKEMDDQLALNRDTMFFLATDNKSEEEFLINQYPEKIITNNKVFSRRSSQGIKDAAIDLFCLSNTSQILGSYYSSFSEVASQLSGIPLKIMK